MAFRLLQVSLLRDLISIHMMIWTGFIFLMINGKSLIYQKTWQGQEPMMCFQGLGKHDFYSEYHSLLHNFRSSQTQHKEIEKATRGQGKNIVWAKERKGRLTASNFGR